MKIFNSNRTGHISAAVALGAVTLATAIALKDAHIAVAAVTVPAWELWGTCDNDIDTRSSRKGPWYRRLWVCWWKKYALRTPHRSKLSHSIFPGTFLRLGVGCWPILWGMLLYSVMVSGGVFHLMDWSIAVLCGCIAADTLHLLKDGFGLSEIVFGK